MKQPVIQKPIPYYEQFYHSLRAMILEGTLIPGERINETQLAKDFGVSRSPIREAIRVLEREGLIVSDEKAKVMVYQPTFQDVEEIYQCRQALESFAVRLMIDAAGADETEQLGRVLNETKQAVHREAPAREIIELNESFHNHIILFSRNNRLKKHIGELRSLIYLFRTYNFTGTERALTIEAEHAAIYREIKDGNKEAAAKAMTDHLEHDLSYLKEQLQAKALIV